MEVLKVYGGVLSQPCRSVICFCEYSKVPYELVAVDLLKEEHLTLEFQAMNPFRAIPTIAHGDYYLNESTAIITYIADAFNVDNDWYPKDIKQRGMINSYFQLHPTFTRQPCKNYFFDFLVGPKYFGCQEVTAEELEKLRGNYSQFFKDLEWLLGFTGYIARTQGMTIADVCAYSEIAQTLGLSQEWQDYPKVRQWIKEVGSHEVVSKIHEQIRSLIASGI